MRAKLYFADALHLSLAQSTVLPLQLTSDPDTRFGGPTLTALPAG